MERKTFFRGLFGIGIISAIPISLQAINKEKSDIEENDVIGHIIMGEIIRLKQSYLDHHNYGPWKLYIPTASKNIVDKLFHLHNLNLHKITIMESMKEICGIEKVIISNKFSSRCFSLIPKSINNKEEYWSYWKNVYRDKDVWHLSTLILDK